MRSGSPCCWRRISAEANSEPESHGCVALLPSGLILPHAIPIMLKPLTLALLASTPLWASSLPFSSAAPECPAPAQQTAVVQDEETLRAQLAVLGAETLEARPVWLQLGEHYADASEWERAARCYRTAATGEVGAPELVGAPEVIEEVEEEPLVEESIFEEGTEGTAVQRAVLLKRRIEESLSQPSKAQTPEVISQRVRDRFDYAGALMELASAEADPEYYWDVAVQHLEELVFEVGDGTPAALEAYIVIGDVKAQQGHWQDAANFYEAAARRSLETAENAGGSGD